MRPRTTALLKAVEHPLVRMAAAALLQAAADQLARTGTTGPSCASACKGGGS